MMKKSIVKPLAEWLNSQQQMDREKFIWQERYLNLHLLDACRYFDSCTGGKKYMQHYSYMKVIFNDGSINEKTTIWEACIQVYQYLVHARQGEHQKDIRRATKCLYFILVEPFYDRLPEDYRPKGEFGRRMEEIRTPDPGEEPEEGADDSFISYEEWRELFH
jgi:hypothetical protein